MESPQSQPAQTYSTHRRDALRVVRDVGEGGPDDHDLMRMIQGDDERAFGQLVSRHEQRIRRMCLAILGDPSRADEVAQETFLKVWAHRRKYVPTTNFRAYLFAIARNACRSQLRRRRLLSFVGLEADVVCERDHADAQLAGEQVAQIVRRALGQLEEKFRTPVYLRFVEELSYEEIAAVIDRTPSTVRSRVFYGLRALSTQLPKDIQP